MSKRWVEIPVRQDVRDMIKEFKGELTYNDFFIQMVQIMKKQNIYAININRLVIDK